MGPFDWNGNGTHDAFDTFMDMKIIEDANRDDDYSDDTSDYDDDDIYADDTSDFDNDDTDFDDDITSSSGYTPPSHFSSRAANNKKASNMSFQDELKQNMRTPEAAKKENSEILNGAMRYDAERTLSEIKSTLIYKAKNAEYITENGVTYLTCFCQMPYRFMKTRREDNGDQLKQNQQTFFLFRDSNLVYMTWNNYEIEPKYSNEYRIYISILKELAAKENITIESVVYSGKEKKYVPFPSRVRNDYSTGWHLCAKATTVVSGNLENVQTKAAPKPEPTTTAHAQNHIESKQQEANEAVIVKSLLCIAVCVVGFVIMINVGGLIGAAALIGAALLGYKITKLK